ncbi:MAG: cytosol nonspecific dipeptidase [Bacteroidetes bacterium HGW-Bacteroidetes-10]|nr:MAG: cytosol nonspecific dipeptidase [Bacteroidetes bacterium HGW-Bacteroidetes-10]
MEYAKVFSIFHEICKIPRESGHEENIIAYLEQFAASRRLNCQRDKAGNVLITKPGTQGMENAPTVILQSHSDMVCEKNSGIEHDFRKDPIKVTEENGWLIAKETTLGADCGIGVAAQLAILDSDTLVHGPIEALFTTEEETGLTGAKSLEPGFLKGSILINLDSEDEGELFIGCAGGIDTTGRFRYGTKRCRAGLKFMKFGIFGATGGHSGDDIEKNRANANQIILRFLYEAYSRFEIYLCEIDGGNKRNAIAREAFAVIGVDPSDADGVAEIFERIVSEVKTEHAVSDPELFGKTGNSTPYEECIDNETFPKLLCALYAMPHGVLAMSQDIPGFVETSTNLASIKMESEGVIKVATSQRSSITSARNNAAKRIEAILKLAGADVTHETDYPGWKPNPDSKILKITESTYKELFPNKPVVRAIHAGLECGILIDKFPHLDIISFGPTVKGAHAPGEKLEIASVEKFWRLLVEVLKKLK